MSLVVPAPSPRERCYRCHKPRVTCVCATIRRVENRTPIAVVQHPRERFHPIGTARILDLSLQRVHIEVAFRGALASPPGWLLPGAGLLYPAADAVELGTASGPVPTQLVVLDGTWHHARTLYRDLPWLRGLPRYRLRPAEPSRYRIRREPTRDSISTVEAVAQALALLEPSTPGIAELIRTFDHMIDTQIEYIEARQGARPKRKRRSDDHRALPRALAEDFEHLVVAYAETLRPGYEAPREAREIVQLVALRVASGELFERLGQPSLPPSEKHLAHMQLTTADFTSALAPESLARDWRSFLRPDDLLAAWNQSTLDVMNRVRLTTGGLVLKGTYGSVTGQRSGTLDELVAREGLAPEPLPLRGRAARRLASAAAVATRLGVYRPTIRA